MSASVVNPFKFELLDEKFEALKMKYFSVINNLFPVLAL